MTGKSPDAINRQHPALPRISIVTPSFNQGEFLEECIDSILSQNYPNLEYVIMDGGSTDNSVEIIRKYEKYLAYWQSGPDGGQYAAIDEGFRRTNGEVMGWLNSDDKLHHQALFKVASLFTGHPEVEWLTGRTNIWNKDGSVQFILCEYLPSFSREKYLNRDFMDPCIQQETTFWRRALWNRAGGGLKTDLQYAGDIELWARFFRHAPLYTVDTLLGGFRKYGNQKTALFMDRYLAEAEAVLDEELRLFKAGTHPDLLPAAAPLVIDQRKLRAFIDSAWQAAPFPIYSPAGNADLVISYLAAQLRGLSASGHGTRRYLESLEFARSDSSEEMSTLVAALNGALAGRGSGKENDGLSEPGEGIVSRWPAIARELEEKTLLANELKAKLEKVTQPEETVKSMVLLLLKKAGLYKLTVRHEPFLSRVYRGVRKLFVRKV